MKATTCESRLPETVQDAWRNLGAGISLFVSASTVAVSSPAILRRGVRARVPWIGRTSRAARLLSGCKPAPTNVYLL